MVTGALVHFICHPLNEANWKMLTHDSKELLDSVKFCDCSDH